MNTTIETDIKQQVRQFYDQIGWQETGEGIYQNARYEDLRPVSREYIHRCHLRVARHLKPSGEYLLDAGSGPIQYPEYLEYSRGYQARVCVDISMVALQEARRRIGDRQKGGHGFFVVVDVANLPFKPEVFDGVISLHTIHHLPEIEHRRAYVELYRVLALHSTAVVVNGWADPPLVRFFIVPLQWTKRLRRKARRILGKEPRPQMSGNSKTGQGISESKGTFVSKNNAAWMKQEIGSSLPLEILVWRSVSVKFLRIYVHRWLGGRWILRLLFWLEERFPHFFGENGQYPLIVIGKT
jgi:SAM-dependent methyltransferase